MNRMDTVFDRALDLILTNSWRIREPKKDSMEEAQEKFIETLRKTADSF